MICGICGGPVQWQGPFSNLSHTLCLDCGAINSQHMPPKEDRDGEEEE